MKVSSLICLLSVAGGRDTAGLGGVGGPYRLDGGHDVHQVSQQVKDQVPEHVSVCVCLSVCAL